MPFLWLNLLIFIPLLGAFALAFIPRNNSRSIEWAALLSTVPPLLIAAFLWYSWVQSDGTPLSGSVEWIPSLHIQYSLGVDGFSIPMIGLTALLSSLCVFYSFGRITTRVREYYIFMLLLECFLLGVFCARDLFLFYVLFDASLVPMYFLIALWGGERSSYAAIRFFLYTLAGSAALLIGVLWVYFRSAAVDGTGEPTFDMIELARLNLFHGAPGAQFVLFFLFGVAFAIKIPIFPFHTWLPDAYVEAPSAVTAMLAGAMGKMGVYGFLRLALPLFPEGARAWSTPLMVLGVISVIYGAFVALAQWDLKRLVAYSSVSHMGFVALGLAAGARAASVGSLSDPKVPLSGVLFEMFAHGIITGALFLLVGMLAERAGIRSLRELGGAIRTAPVFVILFVTAMFASMAMPGLMGFWGELYILLGSFGSFPVGTGLCAIGIIITAGFFVWALQRMAYGTTSEVSARLSDVNSREVGSVVPLVVIMFLFGFLPGLYLSPSFSVTVQQLAGLLGRS